MNALRPDRLETGRLGQPDPSSGGSSTRLMFFLKGKKLRLERAAAWNQFKGAKPHLILPAHLSSVDGWMLS